MTLNFEMEFNDNLELGNFIHDVFDKYMDNLKSIRRVELVEEIPITDPYAVMWDANNVNWTKDDDYNRMFIRNQVQYLNDKFKRDGYLFLNDVYHSLGFPKTSVGQVVGWLYRPTDPDWHGDNYVDFEILEATPDGRMLLSFNVDGRIVEYIDK